MTANTQAMVTMQEKIGERVAYSRALIDRMGIKAEVYERIALNALLNVPKLAECSIESMDKAIIDSVTCGLVPDSHEAVIIPYNGVATFQPMIEGQLKLARKATPGLSIRVRVVYEDDHFEHSEGLRVTLNHRPMPSASQREQDIVAAYAVANIPGAYEPEFVVMYRTEINRLRSLSRRSDSGPWQDHFGEMCKKAVLKPLLKRLPKGIGAPSDTPAGLEDWELDAGTPPPSVETPTAPATPEPVQQQPAQPATRKAAKPRQSRQSAPPAAPEPPEDLDGPPDDLNDSPF